MKKSKFEKDLESGKDLAQIVWDNFITEPLCPNCGEKTQLEIKETRLRAKFIRTHFCKVFNGDCTAQVTFRKKK